MRIGVPHVDPVQLRAFSPWPRIAWPTCAWRLRVYRHGFLALGVTSGPNAGADAQVGIRYVSKTDGSPPPE